MRSFVTLSLTVFLSTVALAAIPKNAQAQTKYQTQIAQLNPDNPKPSPPKPKPPHYKN